jgi:DMSO/TMAO reductase YedYZ molybdopterin-dependent catalytic subunit
LSAQSGKKVVPTNYIEGSSKEGKFMSNLSKMKTPIFWAEGHPGKLDRDSWEIRISGKCRKPATLGWQDIRALPKSIVEGRLTSVTRFSVFGRWGGLRISDLAELAEIDSSVQFVRFWSVGKIYDTSIPLKTALKEKSMLAYEFDDDQLEEDYGGPVRFFCPYLWGYKSAKSVVEVNFMDEYVSGFWEKRGYTDDANIMKGMVRDINDGGRLREIPDGEVVRFLD